MIGAIIENPSIRIFDPLIKGAFRRKLVSVTTKAVRPKPTAEIGRAHV